MPIRAVFFDMGNVLVPFDFTRAYAGLRAVSPLPIEEMSRRLRADGIVARYECGQVEDDAFYKAVTQLLEMQTDYVHFCELWNSIFLPPTLVPESLLETLAAKVPLLLLSNTNAIHFRFIEERYPHIRHFRHKVLSQEVGAQKPARAIYDAALATTGISPQEIFFTDDMAENIEAARALGIDAEQFTGVERLEGHLRQRGLLD